MRAQSSKINEDGTPPLHLLNQSLPTMGVLSGEDDAYPLPLLDLSHSKMGVPPTNSEVASYENACRVDPVIRSFDSTLRRRTSRVVSTLTEGVKVGSLLLGSLGEVTDCFSETNQEVVTFILECKNDVQKNEVLLELVQDYSQSSVQTLEFCNALEKFLNRVRDSQSKIKVAVEQFEREQNSGFDGKRSKSTLLQRLNKLKSADNQFTEEFLWSVQSYSEKQRKMLEDLRAKKSKLDKKLKCVKAWRTLSNVIYGATFAAVFICSVVAAVTVAPVFVMALASLQVGGYPIWRMGKWIDSLWGRYENKLKVQAEIMETTFTVTNTEITELEDIRLLVEELKNKIEALFSEDKDVMLAIDEIKKKLASFMETIGKLSQHIDKCRADTFSGRMLILEKIIKHPNN